VTEKPDTATIREQVADLCDWPAVRAYVAVEVIETLCEALDAARALAEELESSGDYAETQRARAERAEARIAAALALPGTPHADWGGKPVVLVEDLRRALTEETPRGERLALTQQEQDGLDYP
jgi:hypothetical protein